MPNRDAIAQALSILAPRIPRFERDAILDHAQDSRGLATASPQAAAWLSLTAYVRHALTDYEALCDDGYDEDAARHFVADEMNRILADWGCAKRV